MKQSDSIENANKHTEQWILYRQDYVEKSLKWLGKSPAASIPRCTSYRIELITLMPFDIWQNQSPLPKPKYHVVYDGLYRAE